MLPLVVLAIDRRGYAFDNIALALRRLLGDEYALETVPYPEILGGWRPSRQVDLAVAFWWPSAPRLQEVLHPRALLTCLFDGYSTREPAALADFRRVFQRGHVAIVNRGFFDRAPPGYAPSVIEDAVDCSLFTPRPLPGTFRVGWVGNSDGAQLKDGKAKDLKGLNIIRAACERAGVPLVVQDLAADGLRPHDTMPAWYEQVSCYVCASELEGGPNPVLEALASGRPVVSTAVGLIPDLADQGAPVAVVERSVGGIAQALVRMRDARPGERAAWALEARRVALLHDRGAKVHQWREAFARALGVPVAPRPVAPAPPPVALQAAPAAPLAGRPDWTGRVTAFCISSGEPSREECLRRLRGQDVRVRVEEIRDVSPMDRAFQAMLDRCTTELYVQVDADMMLEPDAIRRLVTGIDAQPPDVAMWCAWLWGDAEEVPIQGCKVYRHAITRRFPYGSSLSCEVPQLEAMKAAGFRFESQARPESRSGCVGLHFSLQSPEMAFYRWKRLAQKYRARAYMAWLGDRFPLLRKRFLEAVASGDSIQTHIREAAWQGAMSGLTGELPAEREVDAAAPRDDWRRTLMVFGDWAPGPRELSLYVSQRCNARCEFCLRSRDEGASLDGPGMMHPARLEEILDSLPTVRSVCLAGFGEPLLNPHLTALIAECRRRNLWAGLITNGLLLSRHARGLADAGISRVTVSLNASTAEEHEAAHRVPGWDVVLEGIRAMVATGIPVAISCVTHRGNAGQIPAFLALGRSLGVSSIDLPNILPHGSVDAQFRDRVLTRDCPELALVEAARELPDAELVGHWPVPIDPEGECPRRCDSPFMSIGVDCEGWITGCRRVMPPSKDLGHYSWEEQWRWRGLHYSALRKAMTGDAELPEQCRWCFASWSH